MDSKLITLEVAYANPEQQVINQIAVPEGSTVEQAIKLSGILKQFPEIEATAIKAGIFGQLCKLDQMVSQADRIEIYRPLIHDPKEARRQRAAK